MNNICLLGRLTKAPEMKTSGNTTYCRFSLAVPRANSKEKITDFFNCTAFGKVAEVIEKYVKKGEQLCVQGRMEFNVKDKVTYHNVNVSNITFISSNGGNSNEKSKNDTDDDYDFDDTPKQKAKAKDPEPPIDDDDEYPF